MRIFLAALLLLASSAVAQTVPGGPAAHRLMLMPTARAIPAGQWSLGVTEVVIPSLSTGLGGGVSVGAGVLAAPKSGFLGTLFVEPKVTVVDQPGLAVALGATGRIDPTDDVDAFAVPYAVATLGSARTPGELAVTAGLGARVNVRPVYDPSAFLRGTPPEVRIDPGFFASEPSHEVYVVPAPTVFVGGEMRVSETSTMMVEAGALPDQNVSYNALYGTECVGVCYYTQDDVITSSRLVRGDLHYDFSLGLAHRYATQRLAVDAGLMLVRTDDGIDRPQLGALPWIALTVR